jgi:LacI family transcriptional regulator
MAAAHLIGMGLRHFAFVGTAGDRRSLASHAGYSEAIVERAVETYWVEPPGAKSIATWLAALERPLAVFAATDELALDLLRAAQKLGLGVPTEVAILGAGNDPLLCDYADGGLSSIVLPFEQLGFEAAQHLDRWIRNGERFSSWLVQPSHVCARGSTDALFEIPAPIAQAIRFIRTQAFSGIRIQDVLDHVGISRRSLENGVRAALGLSPYEEILRLRLDRAQWLLARTHQPLADVAQHSGFSDSRQMSSTFRKRLDRSPSEYRTRARLLLLRPNKE